MSELMRRVRKDLDTWTDGALTIALLAVAAALVVVAVASRSHLLKAAVLAWALLP